MAGAASSLNDLSRDINVLPLIDVLLVLIIVFFLLIRNLTFIPAQVPPPARVANPAHGPPQLVLELRAGGSFALNGQPIPAEQLELQLQSAFEGRANKLLFIKASDELPYQAVVSAMDRARKAGVEALALVPRERP
jgi:biopolymer transport protein ExbD